MHIPLSIHHLLTIPLTLAVAAAFKHPAPPGQQTYHLKTRTNGNNSSTSKNGLYLMAYHNGIYSPSFTFFVDIHQSSLC